MKKLKKVGKGAKFKQKGTKLISRMKKKIVKKSKFIPQLIKEYPDIPSPHNTSQYLIANNSSSFCPEEEDDSDNNHTYLDLSPTFPYITDIIKTEELNELFQSQNLDLDLNSTAANSMEFPEIKLPLE